MEREMILRGLTAQDLELVKKIHNEYYSNLDFPNFLSFLNSFIITDDNDSFILAGGVEIKAEGYLVTDKSQSLIKIGRAINEAHLISLFTCKKFNIKEFLAFIYSDDYAKHFYQRGYKDRTGKALFLEVK